MTWIEAFGLTHAVELPIYVALLRDASRLRRLSMGFAVSAATHPWVWFVLPPVLLPALGYTGFVVCVELLVIAAEAALLRGFGQPGRRALIAAAVANGTSALVGLVAARLSGG